MKKKYIILIIFGMLVPGTLVASGDGFSAADTNEMTTSHQSGDINILFLLPEQYGANTFYNWDYCELFGWNVYFTGLSEMVRPCSNAQGYGCPYLSVDVLISDIDDISTYDVLAIMPSPSRYGDPYRSLLNSRDALDVISRATENGLVIWATCAGPRVLAAADVINGVHIQGKPAYREEYEAAGGIYVGENIPPVIDNSIVTTTRGMFYNKKNIEAIATALEMKNGHSLTPTIGASDITNISSLRLNDTVWSRAFGGVASDGGKAIRETDDGGFVVTGYTFSSGAGNADIFLIKTDAEGNELWSRTFGGDNFEYGHDVCETIDGGYVIVGYSSSYSNSLDKDVIVIKTDLFGDEQWSTNIGGTGVDVGASVCELQDGSIMVCGYTESYGAGEDDIYLIKLSTNGTVGWEKTFGGSSAEMGCQVDETSDGNCIVVGSTGSFGRGNRDFYLIKVNSDGNELWSNTYGHGGYEGYDRANSVCETSDGGFIVAGDANIGDIGNIYVVKTDAEGNQLWSKILGNEFCDYGNSVIETSDNCYLVCGVTRRLPNNNNDAYVVKLDSNGNELWIKTFGDTGSEWPCMVSETADNNYVMVGHTTSFGFGSFDIWLTKILSTETQRPEKPMRPNGPTSGKPLRDCTYSTSATDPDGDEVYYLFDWDDGTNSGWLGPYESGEECRAIHAWSEQGNYQIRAKAKDTAGAESEWSDPLSISIPKTYENPLFTFIEKLVDWLERMFGRERPPTIFNF